MLFGEPVYGFWVPVARSVYRNTRKTDRIERHESAPRPELPTVVRDALTYSDPGALGELAAYVRRQNTGDPLLSAQLRLLERLVEEGVDPEHDGLTAAEVAERIDRGVTHERWY